MGHHDAAGALRPQPDFHRPVAPAALGEHDQSAAARAHDSFAGYPQDALRGGTIQTDLCRQAGAQAAIGIGQFDPYPQCATVRVGFRQNRIDCPGEHFARKGRQASFDRLALRNRASF
ncbi:hypothetical protein D9M69_530500 [compost metagenome]